MPKPSSDERHPPPTVRPVMVPCTFCERSVDLEELAAARHLAFACPKVPELLRQQIEAEPGVAVVDARVVGASAAAAARSGEKGKRAKPGGYGPRALRGGLRR